MKFDNFSPFMSTHLMVKITDKTMGFTRQKEFCSTNDLNMGDNLIVLITTTGTWTDSISTNLVWTATQFVKL